MSLTSEVVYKSNGVRVASEATSMQLEGPATVKLGVDPQSVLRLERAGDDLVLVLKDGRKVTVSDFFAVDAQGQGSDLVLQGQDGVSWLGERTGAGADFHFTQMPAEAAPVAAAAGAGGSSMPWVLAGLGGAGALAAAGGGGGGGGDDSPAPAVNNPPTATAVPLATAEDTLGTGRITASDPDGNTLTYRLATGPTQGSVTVDPATGVYNYTPKAHYHGEDSFAIAVEDGKGGSTTVTVKVTVTPVNDAPYGMETNHTGREDLPFSASVDTNDPDGDMLVYSLATGPEHGSVVVNPDGTYVYTPAANYHGTDTFTLKADDGHGGTSMNKVTITLAPVNDAPKSLFEEFFSPEDAVFNGRIKASDPEGDTLTFALDRAPRYGTVTVHADGTYTYVPDADVNGYDEFTVTVSDGNGGVTTAGARIFFEPVNDAPTVEDQAVTTLEDTPVNGQVIAQDIDGDALDYIRGSDPAHGRLIMRLDGTYTYIPDDHFHGTDTFTVIARDNKGGTATSTVTVTVESVNDAPWILPQTLATEADTPLTEAVVAIDFDGDAMSYQLAPVPAGTTAGHVDMRADGTYTYTPAAGFAGTDRFLVRVTDSQGLVSDEWLTVEVAPPNQAPIVTSNEPLVVDEDNRGWGSITFSDPDGANLVYRIHTAPAHGSVTISAVGHATLQYSYDPDPNYNGPDSFVVETNDGRGGITTATVMVTVNPVNDAPIVAPAQVSGTEDTPVHGTVTATDIDGGTLTYQLWGGAGYGSVVVDPATGSYTYTPPSGFTGTDDFVVRVDDGQGGSTNVTVYVTITPVVDAAMFSMQPLGAYASGDGIPALPVGSIDTLPDGGHGGIMGRCESGVGLGTAMQGELPTAGSHVLPALHEVLVGADDGGTAIGLFAEAAVRSSPSMGVPQAAGLELGILHVSNPIDDIQSQHELPLV